MWNFDLLFIRHFEMVLTMFDDISSHFYYPYNKAYKTAFMESTLFIIFKSELGAFISKTREMTLVHVCRYLYRTHQQQWSNLSLAPHWLPFMKDRQHKYDWYPRWRKCQAISTTHLSLNSYICHQASNKAWLSSSIKITKWSVHQKYD